MPNVYRIEQLEMCNRQMFGDLVLTCQMPPLPIPIRDVALKLSSDSVNIIRPIPYSMGLPRRSSADDAVMMKNTLENERRRASALVDELLVDIYDHLQTGTTDYNSATSGRSHKSIWMDIVDLHEKDVTELILITERLKAHVERMGSILVRQLKRRDALRRQQDTNCDVITRKLSKRAAEGIDMRFTIQPIPGESGFSQWAAAMKMVAQLPGGIPAEFRSRLWLTLADRHLASRNIDWPKIERTCFSEWSHPTDSELGIQIVKDLHRTGCSLFCGEDGIENQALLKRVLLAYARWNKAVGYCQGFNMLAALILQVTDKSDSDALKLMIYLIEGVLPDSYFADSLRGLSVDMAVFRELLKSRLPRLSKHLDTLQNAAKDGTTSYEPPLTNVFTMQWFLTLFCNCLPQPTVLRVWDLILLEGNEILLRTALAIWQTLADRILSVRSADEFYCIMGVLTRELLEFGLIDGNTLIKAVVSIGPLTELKTLREHYLYNINPWGPSLSQAMVDKQLKLYPRERLALDISALKKQYVKLKQRQRQAHIIFSAAISRQPPASTPVAMNHLLLGKSALVTAKRLGPLKGSIPPPRQPLTPSTLHWKDTKRGDSSSSSSSDTELCDEDEESSSSTPEPSQSPPSPPTSSQNDNLQPSSDNSNLMIQDNTINSSAKADSASDNFNLLDFDSVIPPEATSVKTELGNEEENFDFEQFLAQRVSCLKEPPKEEIRVSLTRRNSERALQIIQENSLILHRILQCQSQLSPSSPPPTSSDDQSCFSESFSNLTNLITDLDDSTSERSTKSKELQEKFCELLKSDEVLPPDEGYNESFQNSITSLKESKLDDVQFSSSSFPEFSKTIYDSLCSEETQKLTKKIYDSLSLTLNVSDEMQKIVKNSYDSLSPTLSLSEESQKMGKKPYDSLSPILSVSGESQKMTKKVYDSLSTHLSVCDESQKEIKIGYVPLSPIFNVSDESQKTIYDSSSPAILPDESSTKKIFEPSPTISKLQESESPTFYIIDEFLKTESFSNSQKMESSVEDEFFNKSFKITSPKPLPESPVSDEVKAIEMSSSPPKSDKESSKCSKIRPSILQNVESNSSQILSDFLKTNESIVDSLLKIEDSKLYQIEKDESPSPLRNLEDSFLSSQSYKDFLKTVPDPLTPEESRNLVPSSPTKLEDQKEKREFLNLDLIPPSSDKTIPESSLTSANLRINPENDKFSEISSWVDSVSHGSIEDSKELLKQLQSKFNLKIGAKSPEYGSKYKSILEKSKSLDERYNSLILQSNLSKLDEKGVEEEDEKKENVSPIAPAAESPNSKTCYNFVSSPNKSPLPSSPIKDDLKFLKSKKDDNLKSPTKIFNPFPVQLSSRQSKEVPLKLGLYKK